ncbi:Hypothetical_protein [Hexamita inflata]|uniref:Hypothetical_protein n=1 Tax=Hexamita inflata TaxID=28002 RepID=A0ABP1LVW5_9EUKA
MQIHSFTKAASILLNINLKDSIAVQSYIVQYFSFNPQSYMWFELSYIFNKPVSAIKSFYINVYLKAFNQQSRSKSEEIFYSSTAETLLFTKQLEKLLQLTESD